MYQLSTLTDLEWRPATLRSKIEIYLRLSYFIFFLHEIINWEPEKRSPSEYFWRRRCYFHWQCQAVSLHVRIRHNRIKLADDGAVLGLSRQSLHELSFFFFFFLAANTQWPGVCICDFICILAYVKEKKKSCPFFFLLRPVKTILWLSLNRPRVQFLFDRRFVDYPLKW